MPDLPRASNEALFSTAPFEPLAIDEPGVRDALHNRRETAAVTLAVGILLVVYTMVGGGALNRMFLARQDRLESHPGQVLRTHGPVGIVVEYYVGDTRMETLVHVSSNSSYSRGDSVTVLVDPDSRQRVTVRGENYYPLAVGIALFTVWCSGVALVVVATVWRSRIRRTTNRLMSGPWRARAARSVGKQGSKLLVDLEHDDGGTVLIEAFRPNSLPRSGTWDAEVAGVDHCVIRPVGSDVLALARPTRSTPDASVQSL